MDGYIRLSIVTLLLIATGCRKDDSLEKAKTITVKFAGEGEATTVESVVVKNLNNEISITIDDGAALTLIEDSDKALTLPSKKNTMYISAGDRLLFKGKSGIYATVITAIPENNMVITFPFVECTDADGNNYAVVKIGTQLWMAENLRTTTYNDGTAIPYKLTDWETWCNLTSGAYCNYDDLPYISSIYGCLYNWYAVYTGKLAPKGWHVPTDSEWAILFSNYGSTRVSYNGKLKETGTQHWTSPNIEATNETGFSAIPAGTRASMSHQNGFTSLYKSASWWSSTPIEVWKPTDSGDTRYAYYWGIYNFYGTPWSRSYTFMVNGCSIRCIKDYKSIRYY